MIDLEKAQNKILLSDEPLIVSSQPYNFPSDFLNAKCTVLHSKHYTDLLVMKWPGAFQSSSDSYRSFHRLVIIGICMEARFEPPEVLTL